MADDEGRQITPRLVKTLVPSPVVKSIFEANLRTPDSNDIILVKVPLSYTRLT
jgi:hypothetical protein